LRITLSNLALAAGPAMAAVPAANLRNPRGDYPNRDMPLLSLSAQNCNSLNISTECHIQLTKLIAITSLLTDIIFLSDLRLNNSAEHVQRIEKHFLYAGSRSYKLYANLKEVFGFLNFGENAKKWLKLYGENRTACIILDDESYSKSFDLERSRAQGDNISPNTFNFADQILIWKIELDVNITGIWQNFRIRPGIGQINNDFFAHELERQTSRN
jgi:hypothetical protein